MGTFYKTTGLVGVRKSMSWDKKKKVWVGEEFHFSKRLRRHRN